MAHKRKYDGDEEDNDDGDCGDSGDLVFSYDSPDESPPPDDDDGEPIDFSELYTPKAERIKLADEGGLATIKKEEAVDDDNDDQEEKRHRTATVHISKTDPAADSFPAAVAAVSPKTADSKTVCTMELACRAARTHFVYRYNDESFPSTTSALVALLASQLDRSRDKDLLFHCFMLEGRPPKSDTDDAYDAKELQTAMAYVLSDDVKKRFNTSAAEVGVYMDRSSTDDTKKSTVGAVASPLLLGSDTVYVVDDEGNERERTVFDMTLGNSWFALRDHLAIKSTKPSRSTIGAYASAVALIQPLDPSRVVYILTTDQLNRFKTATLSEFYIRHASSCRRARAIDLRNDARFVVLVGDPNRFVQHRCDVAEHVATVHRPDRTVAYSINSGPFMPPASIHAFRRLFPLGHIPKKLPLGASDSLQRVPAAQWLKHRDDLGESYRDDLIYYFLWLVYNRSRQYSPAEHRFFEQFLPTGQTLGLASSTVDDYRSLLRECHKVESVKRFYPKSASIIEYEYKRLFRGGDDLNKPPRATVRECLVCQTALPVDTDLCDKCFRERVSTCVIHRQSRLHYDKTLKEYRCSVCESLASTFVPVAKKTITAAAKSTMTTTTTTTQVMTTQILKS